MFDAIHTAKARREKLLEEVALIDRYLELHHQIFGEAVTETLVATDTAEAEVVPVANREKARPLNDPVAIVNELDEILASSSEPMTRGQLRSALAARGVSINSKDASKYLGTLLWRNQNRFVNVEGHGYWNKGRDLPAHLLDKDELFQ